ncbi:hypothetical protein CEP52_016587 [Fusarium oligoseptatum]|uniref:Uncharacterized protein n=1 Tax=Fusarium oligoseptatum TaxID=2604345 RepID=A0A428S212_9HYPO|nr:hypothetical protein CEP52_016587 [Fusarium oligoseptatum]
MARLDFLSSSCKVLQDCADALPDSAPSYQVLHPSCQLCRADDCSPEAMIKNLEEWSVTARAGNLTGRDETESDKWIAKSFSPNRMAEYFWPNNTEFPILFDQAMTLAQLKDVMNQTVEAAEVIKKANHKIQDKGIFDRIKGWAKSEQVLPDPEDDVKQLKKLLQVRFYHQLRDIVQGIQAVSDICGELSTLLSLVNELYSPSNWIIEEGGSTVMLQKMLHPKDQAKALNNLRWKLDRRLGVLGRYYQLWAWSDGLFGEEEEEVKEDQDDEDQDEEEQDEEESEE